MNSATQAESVVADWIHSLAGEALPEVVRAIYNRGLRLTDSERSALADCFERSAPERLDYLLYREFVTSPQRHGPARRELCDPGRRVDHIIEALNSPNPLVAKGSRLVLTSFKYRHLEELSGAGHAALDRLSEALDRSKPIREGFDATLCDAVCIPYVKLMLLEAKTKRLWAEQKSKPIGFHPSVSLLQPVVAEIAEALKEVLNRRDPRTLGESLPLDPKGLYLVTKSVPWVYKETFSLVSKTLVDVGSYIGGIDNGVKEAGLDTFLRLLDQSILLVQCGWLSQRKLSEALQTHGHETPFVLREMEALQIKALAHLAELQHLRGNHILAAQYAVFALHANLALNQFKTEWHIGSDDNTPLAEHTGALTTSECSTMRTLANRMGLFVAGRWRQGGKMSRPRVYAEMLRLQPRFGEFFVTLQELGRKWDGYEENVLKVLAGCSGAELICRVLESAIHTGNLRLVLNLSKKYGLDEQHPHRRARVLAAVNPATVLLYADALASVQQQAVALCYENAKSRTSLRTIWKQVSPDQFSVRETLFLHHVKVGFSYYGLASHYSGEQATWALYKSAPQTIRNQLFADFAGMVGSGRFVPMTLADFRKGALSIGPDEVLVSLCSREGHEASLIVCGPNGSFHYIIDSGSAHLLGNGVTTTQRDWNKILEEFSTIASHRIRHGHPVQQEPAVLGLAMRMIDAIRAANPNVKRIAFHGDSMFRVVPWQHVFQHWTPVKDYRIASFNTDRARGLRTVADDGGREFVVFHIEGVKFQAANRLAPVTLEGRSREPGWCKRNIDPDDPLCQQIEAALDNPDDDTLGMRNPTGTRLSIVAHGKKHKFASQIEGDDVALTPEEMSNDMSEYELVALHACYGGYTMNNELADLGGLPGFLLSHGCTVLFASPLPLEMKEVLTLERYLSGLANYEAEMVMSAYLNAVREDSACAFYNLYLPQSTPCLNPTNSA